MKFDPTKNRIPAELLTKKEKAALRAAFSNGAEIYSKGDWLTFDRKYVQTNDILRAKPAPAVSPNTPSRAEQLQQALAMPEIAALVEAGNVMANALRGNYIVPGTAGAWGAALAALGVKP